MARLADHLLSEASRSRVITDCVGLVDEEVSRKRGLSGMAIKAAYKTVKAIKPGFVAGVVDALLDEWVDKLEPYFADHQASGAATPFSDLLAGRRDEVAESLLEVTDQRARTTRHRTAQKLYDKLRPGAKANVVEAVGRLGRLVDGYL